MKEAQILGIGLANPTTPVPPGIGSYNAEGQGNDDASRRRRTKHGSGAQLQGFGQSIVHNTSLNQVIASGHAPPRQTDKIRSSSSFLKEKRRGEDIAGVGAGITLDSGIHSSGIAHNTGNEVVTNNSALASAIGGQGGAGGMYA